MKILIVEDEKLLADSLRAMLEGKGFTVEAVYDGETGAEYAETGVYDLLILDVMMPGLDGNQVARQVRARRCGTPILMLTARSSLEDRIEGLNAGADDYLTKPFSVDELLARLRVIQRRLMKSENISVTEFVNGRLRIDYVSGCVHLDDEELHLTPIEYKLLCLLAKNVGKVLTHKYIIQSVWGTPADNSEASLRVFMATLRKKLSDSSQALIQTHIGIGYRMMKL